MALTLTDVMTLQNEYMEKHGMAAPLKDKDAAGRTSSGYDTTTTTSTSYLSPLGGGYTSYSKCEYCGQGFRVGDIHHCPATSISTSPYLAVSDLEGIHGRIDRMTYRLDEMETSINGLTSVLHELLTAMKGLKR